MSESRPTRSSPITRCQVCGQTPLESVLYLGAIPPVNTMPEVGTAPLESEVYPLELKRCNRCTLVQIGLEVDPDVLFPPEYPYRSASTKILRENFADLQAESTSLLRLDQQDLVVDIGSNDGTLLRNFVEAGHRVLGVEPSLAAEAAIAAGIPSRMSFFNQQVGAAIRDDLGPARLVTAANVFAHIGDISNVLGGIVDLLTDDGVFVSESHYLPSLLETLQYDTIYHEHLRYYSLSSLEWLLHLASLEVFHVKRIPTHGGSFRVYAARPGLYEIQPSVSRMAEAEKAAGITDASALGPFRQRVIQSKLDFYRLVAPLKREGARIYGVGAPSRASTLINYVGIDDGIMDCVLEVSSSNKLNRYIPGTRIPVLDEERLFSDQPEFALLLSWHIAVELIGNLRRKGFRGQFITPLPDPRILDG